jgi:hypothetical protein
MLTFTDRCAWVCVPCDASGKLDPVTSQSYMAQVVDLSAWGISLILTRRPALGAYLKFEVLLGPQRFAGSRIARVISTRPGAVYDDWLMKFSKEALPARRLPCASQLW